MKGLSAAGVEVESEGSSRVQPASQECLSLSACGRSGVVQLVRDEGRQRWSLCSCHVDTRLPSEITFSPLNWPKTQCCWTSPRKGWF